MFGRKIRKIIILGCGPAGIFAAHAAATAGKDFQIFSNRRRSEMYGAQYLHAPIPGLSLSPATDIRYTLTGTPEQYANKVYGQEDRPEFVSPESLAGHHLAYDIREAYYNGWKIYNDRITHMPRISHSDLRANQSSRSNPLRDAIADTKSCQVISTIPRTVMCYNQAHSFKARKIWAAGEAPERGIFLDDFTIAGNTVNCNGLSSPSWYRASNVFGYKTIEWPNMERQPPYDNVVEVEKVVGTNCNCWASEDWIWFAGRNGTWSKSVFAHQAFHYPFHVMSTRFM